MDMKELRERAGLRTVDVASMMGIAESTVRNWDVGRHSPRVPIEDVPLLVKVYQASIDEIIAASQESRKKFDRSHP